MSADDWSDACDPVPARREYTPAEKRRLQALIELRRRQRLNGWSASAQAIPTFVDPGFDEEGR